MNKIYSVILLFNLLQQQHLILKLTSADWSGSDAHLRCKNAIKEIMLMIIILTDIIMQHSMYNQESWCFHLKPGLPCKKTNIQHLF